MIERHPRDLSTAQELKLQSTPPSLLHSGPHEDEQHLSLMRSLDVQALDTSFSNVRQMASHLRDDGRGIKEKGFGRLMGLKLNYQRSKASMPEKGLKNFDYLARGLHVE